MKDVTDVPLDRKGCFTGPVLGAQQYGPQVPQGITGRSSGSAGGSSGSCRSNAMASQPTYAMASKLFVNLNTSKMNLMSFQIFKLDGYLAK